MTLKQLPDVLAGQIEAATSSTPMGEMVKMAVAIAKGRETGYDTFASANKLANLIGAKIGEDPLKAFVGLSQANRAGALTGAGLLTNLKEMSEPEIGEWLKQTTSQEALAAALEDIEATLGSPGFIQALGTEVTRWETEIGEKPDLLPQYGDRAEAFRRTSQAFTALAKAAASMWDDPGDAYTGLVAVMAAAKNKQLTGDPAVMAAAVVELSRGLEPMLSDPETMETLTTDREKMGAWIDSPIIMGAAWSNTNASEKLLASAIVIDELCKANSAGKARPGLTILLGSVIGAQALANTSLTNLKTLASSNLVMTTLVDSQVAMDAVASSQVARTQVWQSEIAKASILDPAHEAGLCAYVNVAGGREHGEFNTFTNLFASEVACRAAFASEVACRAIAESETARKALQAQNKVDAFMTAPNMEKHQVTYVLKEAKRSDNFVNWQAVAASQPAMQAVAATPTALKAIVANSTACSIVEGSNTAVNALQNSPLITLVTKSSGNYGEYFYADKCFILGFSQNWGSDSSYTSTYGDFIVGGTQKTVPATNYQRFDKINKFATGARIVAASWGGSYANWANGNVCGVKLIILA